MDGCDARHNEEVLLCTIDRFVMAITPAEVMPRPALASSEKAPVTPIAESRRDYEDRGPQLRLDFGRGTIACAPRAAHRI